MKRLFSTTMLVLFTAGSALATGFHTRPEINFSADTAISLVPVGTYESGAFDEGAAEIGAYDAGSKRLFVTNTNSNTVDILSLRNIYKPRLKDSIDLSAYGGGVNSVAVKNGLVAVAVEAETKQDPGKVVFFDIRGRYLNTVTVGALPDMLTFTPDGLKVLVANEGEPNDEYTVDPEGTVSIIDLRYGVRPLNNDFVKEIDFRAFNGADLAPIRIFGKNASVAQDLEPEYIAVSADSSTAWVSLQENNALAIIDIASATVTKLVPLGTKDYSVIQNAIDASNKDDAINIRPWPIVGMYQPDSIAAYEVDGETYIVTANEGDSRDYDGFSEEERVKDVDLDPDAYPDAEELQKSENLGRLNITTATGDFDDDGDFDLLHAYGGRSFSIRNAAGKLVYDSGSDFERLVAMVNPENFNSTNDENDSFDNRSDDKGPEPEGLTVGSIAGKTYAFIGLERDSGIMVYDITNPIAPQFVQYINNRDFSGDAEAGTAGDLGPEGLVFISAKDSPVQKPLLVVTNEISGTTTVYRIMTQGPLKQH